jgi:FKBP-type peptidyl-prolyl cis-trans isomerase
MASARSAPVKTSSGMKASAEPELDAHSQKIVQVRILMKEREEARKANNFGKSDSIRARLADMGVEVKDQVGGPSGWKFKDGSTRKLNAGAIVPEEAAKKKRDRDEDSSSGDKKKQKTDARDHSRPIEEASKKSKSGEKEKEKGKDGALAPETLKNKKLLDGVMGTTNSSGVVNKEGIIIEDLRIGTGREAMSGKKCSMGYVGRLKSNGKMFDASGSKPFKFNLGRSEVIRGWDIGIVGMREGGKRRLTIPPEKAYGRSGAPPSIPGNATLVFEVTLNEVK